jgi:hypothetical protein
MLVKIVLLPGAIWCSTAVTSKAKLFGNASGGLSLRCKCHRPGRLIEPWRCRPENASLVNFRPKPKRIRVTRRTSSSPTWIYHSNTREMTDRSTIRFADFGRIVRLTSASMRCSMTTWAEENTSPAFRLGFNGTSTRDSTGLRAGRMSDCLRLMDRL